MATIRAFRAARPPKERAADVSAVPYDVVNTAEARELAADNPLSFLHVSRPEIDLADGTDVYSDAVYQKAAQNFEKLKTDAPLFVEETPSLYVYRLRMGEHSQVGVAACCSVDEYDSDIVRKHERTRKDKEDDRTRHIVTLRAQTGPVFLTYRGRGEIDKLTGRITASEPLYDFVAPDGVQHTVWRAGDDETGWLAEEFRNVPLVYIADGHHRAASASRARAGLKSENPNHTGDEEYNFFLTVLFPAEQLRILPYNRVVKDLNGMSADEFIKALSQRFEVSDAASPSPSRKGEICMYLEGRWRRLEVPPGSVQTGDPISSLDVSILQERVLDPLLGIKDVRTDKRIDFVGGVRGTSALEQSVREGRAAVAFSMYPVTVEGLMAIADANEIMPPKSTWFEPKLRDGLLSHLI
ncbi:MAG TPA: DUF1015 family protein [Blastocatellia bacterium]|jgi:uncharacterized protein (DUF1015 family)|nr:DUF1015 family protein [Blastocatellia bacterium]